MSGQDRLEYIQQMPDDEWRAFQAAVQARAEGQISKRDLLKYIGVGATALGGGAMATGSVMADASTSDDDGDVGQPDDRIDVFADGVDSNSVNTEQSVSQTDSNKPDVDTYLNNNITTGETIVIESGTHTVDEITITDQCHLIWRGTLEPAGDHPVINFELGGDRVTIEPEGADHVSTENIGASYTANAINFHGRFKIDGKFEAYGTGDRVVNIEQADGNDNLNHSRGTFRVDGLNESSVGLMVDNSSGDGNNVNDLHIEVWNARQCTDYGVYLNAGQGNTYRIATGANGGSGFGMYAGDGSEGASGTTHSNIELWLRSDGNNGSSDEHSPEVEDVRVLGVPNGGLNSLDLTSVYQEGSKFWNNPVRALQGFGHAPRGNPSPSDIVEGEVVVYASDGTGFGSNGDLIYAWNDAGTIRVQTIAASADATAL